MTGVNRVKRGAWTFVVWLAGIVLVCVPGMSRAQEAKAGEGKGAEARPAVRSYATLYLAHATQQNDMNDIQTSLRNMLPMAKIYGTLSQRAISLSASAEDIATARKIVADLDHPRKVYRLTYTIGDAAGGKGASKPARYSLVVASGEKTSFKEGSRVPLVTGGTAEAGNGAASTQVQYIDVGLSIDAGLDSAADGVLLRTKVEQSSLAEEKSGMGAQDPVIRQTKLEGSTTLTPGKAVVLGSMEMPGEGAGNGRKQEISVVAEAVL